MKQILQSFKTGNTELAEVPAPQVKRGQVLIKTTRSLVSLGTERMLVEFGKASLIQNKEQIKNLKDNEIPKADAVLLFNCIGREMAFGPTIGREIEGIYTIWKSPMAGFFSQGEFGRAKGSALEVHNLTTCCVVLKEK